MSSSTPLLDVRGLTVKFGAHPVLEGLSFSLDKGETLALVGESGSGKSVTALSLLGLLPATAHISSGEILWKGQDRLDQLTDTAFRPLRSRQIGMIFQEPLTALNPTKRIGAQLAEAPRAEGAPSGDQFLLDWIERVKLHDPPRILKAYPHELSGGQRQRILIAMAMMAGPQLLIADEPTTALDSVTEASVLSLLRELVRESQTALLFISHDLAVVRHLADKMILIRHGRRVEAGPTQAVFASPKTDYTNQLIELSPRLRFDAKGPEAPKPSRIVEVKPVALTAENLTLSYPIKRNWRGKATLFLHAVNEVDFTLRSGDFIALVGESGCGKSSLARCICGLNNQWTGTLTPHSPKVQLVFQDPFSSLNPVLSVEAVLSEIVQLRRQAASSKEVTNEVQKLLTSVGLPPEEFLHRLPREMSGGQRQRVAIARALANAPDILICDEAVSALDAALQTEVMQLLNHLRRDHNICILFISHDLALVSEYVDQIWVMDQGRIIERSTPGQIRNKPQSSPAKKLLRAARIKTTDVRR